MDWEVARFYTWSDGEFKYRCAPLQQFLPKLVKLQRRLAHKKKFSNHWKNAKAKITKLHQWIANIRKDFLHKASNDISKNHPAVFVEDLQVKNMSASNAGKGKPRKKIA
jgi:putative transposase